MIKKIDLLVDDGIGPLKVIQDKINELIDEINKLNETIDNHYHVLGPDGIMVRI